MKSASTFFTKQVSLRNALLTGVGLLIALIFLLALMWNPLLQEWGYAKITNSGPQTTPLPGVNALNPAPTEPAPSAENQNISRNIDLSQLYDSIQVGKDRDHLFATSTAAPSNCSTFQVPTLGAEEICTWINGEKAVLFTILNGKILAKSKHGF